MGARRSVSYIDNRPPRRGRPMGLIVLVLVLAALLLLVAGVSFFAANHLMRAQAPPAERMSAQILSDYRNVSFRSFDESFMLKGWYIPATERARANVVVVHGYGQNRLPYGVETGRLYEKLSGEGFNVLAFDLRHSGESGGPHQSFGYAEWEDVAVALEACRQYSGMRDYILLGLGSGATAALQAWEQIPEAEVDREKLARGSASEQRLAGFDYTREDIRGMILDSPARYGDDYVEAALLDWDPIGASLLTYTVPFAVRLSSGLSANAFNVGTLTRFVAPVLLIHPGATAQLPATALDPPRDERERLLPELTRIFEADQHAPLEAYAADPQAYINAIVSFLENWW